MGRVVLVTGVSHDGAALFARHLVERSAELGLSRVVGVDTTLPTVDLGGAKFIRADIRTSAIGKVLAVEDVDTVVHLGVHPGRSTDAKEINVIGTMQLLAACQRAEHLRTFVLCSTTAVYGTSPRDPAVWNESATARGGVKSGFPRQAIEVESYVRGFARRRPDVEVTVLRLAQMVSAQFSSSFTSFLASPVTPMVAGFDPRLQFLHPDDAFRVIGDAAAGGHPGTFNVAGDGVLLLSQVARMLGRPQLMLPPVGQGPIMRRVMRLMGTDITPDLHRLLTFGRVVDTTCLREEFGAGILTHSTRQTLEQYATTLRPGLWHLAGRPR